LPTSLGKAWNTVKQAQFDMTATDDQRIAAYHWGSERSPRALIVLAHGMGEHAQRYRPVLAPLIETGIDVYALDHRGHGATATDAKQLGDFGPSGFAALVADLVTLTGIAKKENPGSAVILLGHSMGSMAAQLFAVQHSDLIDGLALSGTAAVDQVAQAARNPNLLGMLNASFEPARTPFDWLSRDEHEVDAYIADPLCGFALKPESFGSMLSYGTQLAHPVQLARIRKDLPIYVFSGDHDPLSHDLHALQPVIDRYRAAGLRVDVDIYPGARHEILNETNRADVLDALSGWISKVITLWPRP
jgi:alpha-beta hydrolase superfamily lysophospholipase